MNALRTTLAIDEDVMAFARAVAERDRLSVGEVVSKLARRGIEQDFKPGRSTSGRAVLPHRGVVVTLDLVNALRDEE